jgi:ribosome biogenesis GTPase
MGVEVLELAVKAEPEAALALLRPRLAGRTTLVLGPSGAGKSTLINLLAPAARAQVARSRRPVQRPPHHHHHDLVLARRRAQRR